MFVVIFLVQPKQQQKQAYFDLAKQLKPKLETIDGFIDNERFASQRSEKRLLSLSTWRDEKAVMRWRTQGEHHRVQQRGRFEVFEDYHLKVGEVTADSHPPAGGEMLEKRFDETVVGEAKACTLTELTPLEPARQMSADALAARLGLTADNAELPGHELFESIVNPGKRLLLAHWRDASAARRWMPRPFDGIASLRHRQVRVVRDYGMRDRREAPQYYADVDERACDESEHQP